VRACVCVCVYASALYFYAYVVPREILRVTGSLGEERREGKDLLFSEGCVEKGQYEKLRTFRKARGVVEVSTEECLNRVSMHCLRFKGH